MGEHTIGQGEKTLVASCGVREAVEHVGLGADSQKT